MRPLSLLTYFFAAAMLPLIGGCSPGNETTVSAPELTSCMLAGDMSAQCGSITVPENYAQPNGRQLEIHYAVIPAASSQPQPDPVFMLAGGPGQAAIETFPFLIPFFEDLNQGRDIVLVDQRGTGQSQPLDCPQFDELPLDADHATGLLALEECRQDLDDRIDLTQYITDIAMRDLDNVRQALGYEQINLIGTSYGSRAAQVYMRLFPERARTVVLNAVTSPKLILQLQAPADGQRALELLFSRCAADAACAQTFPNFAADFRNITSALGAGQEVTLAHPVSGERTTLTLSAEDLLQSIYSLLYSADLISLLPLLVTQVAETGNYGPLVGQIISLSASLTSYEGMFYAVTCSEDAALLTLEEANAARGDSQFPLAADEFLAACAHWPRATVPIAFREPLTSDVPTLLLSGAADPITPPTYAAEVASGLSNHTQIVLPDYGHDILIVGCIPTVVTTFIQMGTAVDLDTSCTAEIVAPPFFISPAGPQP